MSQMELDRIVATLRAGAGPAPVFSVETARKTWYLYTEDYQIPEGVQAEASTVGPMRVERLFRADARRDRATLYLHGGGYVCGGIETHRPITAELAKTFDGIVVSIDYRLAPEHPYPAALEDALAGFRALLDEGFAPHNVAFGGESAGGGLVMGTMLALKARGLPLPGAGLVISPWSDLTHSGASIVSNQASDPIVFKSAIDLTRDLYLGGASRTDPFGSPGAGGADLKGLPPLLIQVATDEILLDDALNIARLAAHAGVPVTFEGWKGLVHAWHLFSRDLEEGRLACKRAGEWLNATLGPAS
jgi:monoterpene epsilon-lactone hydrolase